MALENCCSFWCTVSKFQVQDSDLAYFGRGSPTLTDSELVIETKLNNSELFNSGYIIPWMTSGLPLVILQDLKEENRGGQSSVRFKIIHTNLTLSLCFPEMRQGYFEVTTGAT